MNLTTDERAALERLRLYEDSHTNPYPGFYGPSGNDPGWDAADDRRLLANALLRESQPAATVTLPTHEGWWWEWNREHWKMQYVWKELSMQQYGYPRWGEFVLAMPGHWLPVAMPPKLEPLTTEQSP